MRLRTGVVGGTLGLVAGLLSFVTASAASITVTPGRVPVGGTVVVSGDVLSPDGKVGGILPGTVTLLSGAFAGQGSFANMDVEASANTDAKFSVRARILPGVRPGTYTITGRFAGANLGVSATLVVTSPGMPVTGSGSTQQAAPMPGMATAAIAVAAGIVIALALAAALVGRRRGPGATG